MDSIDSIASLVDQLDDNLDDLEAAMGPLIQAALSETASKLPLLDRAKLYVLATYAIESVIFSFVKLNGANAKEHPVFRELTRVKQYFEKVKVAETRSQLPKLRVDQAATGRIIKHELAANQRAQRIEPTNPGTFGSGPQSAQVALPNKRKFDEVKQEEPGPTAWREPVAVSDDSPHSPVDESSDSEEEPSSKLSADQKPAADPSVQETKNNSNLPGVKKSKSQKKKARRARLAAKRRKSSNAKAT